MCPLVVPVLGLNAVKSRTLSLDRCYFELFSRARDGSAPRPRCEDQRPALVRSRHGRESIHQLAASHGQRHEAAVALNGSPNDDGRLGGDPSAAQRQRV